MKQKEALINQANITINNLKNQLAQQVQDTQHWNQKYTSENILLAQRDADIQQAQAGIIIINKDLKIAQKEASDAKLELKDKNNEIKKNQDLVASLRKDLQIQEKTQEDFITKQAYAHEVVVRLQEFINTQAAKLPDPFDRKTVLGQENKAPKSAEDLLDQLKALFNSALQSDYSVKTPRKKLFAPKTPKNQFIQTGASPKAQKKADTNCSSPAVFEKGHQLPPSYSFIFSPEKASPNKSPAEKAEKIANTDCSCPAVIENGHEPPPSDPLESSAENALPEIRLSSL